MSGVPLELPWMKQAACLGSADIFFSQGAESLWEARKVCYHCPVFLECTKWALENYDDLPVGIIAGLPESERLAIDCGLKTWKDWRKSFSVEKRLQSIYNLTYRKRERGELPPKPPRKEVPVAVKHDVAVAERPACAECGKKERVNRCGYNTRGEQRWICFRCNRRWVEK